MEARSFFVYIVSNERKNVFYIGMTNSLEARLAEHYFSRGNPGTFAGKYNTYFLLHCEETQYVLNAIEREKELKGWTRAKKEKLVRESNPGFAFLNHEIMDWPPSKDFQRSFGEASR